jgi:Tfp pilus assembly pilus retraction ATPase PilT
MNLESFIALAKEHGASDLHLEPGLPMALRVLGGRFQEKIFVCGICVSVPALAG